MATRRRHNTHYRGFRIESSPYSHLGRRSYEAGIFVEPGSAISRVLSTAGLLDVSYGNTRDEAVEGAKLKIDLHMAGSKPLHNLGNVRPWTVK